MSFGERLASATPLLLDGGMGSALIASGFASGTAPEQWNLDRPESVVAVHRSFVEAGSDAVQTNTFGGNPIRLAAYGLDARCEEINRVAVEHARAAGAHFVIGDVGPTGEYLPPVGSAAVEAWREAFERQAGALGDAGVDAFHVETMSDLREALTALEAIRSLAPGVPVMVSMTFERKKRGFFTVMGDAFMDAVRKLAEAGADAVGANCSVTSGDMREMFDGVALDSGLTLVAQPNAGKPESGDDGTIRYAQRPDEFADDVAAMVWHGVKVVGGCCGTDPHFIATLRQRLEQGP